MSLEDQLWGEIQEDGQEDDVPFPDIFLEDYQSQNNPGNLLKLDGRTQIMDKRHMSYGVGNIDFIQAVQMTMYLKKHRNILPGITPPTINLISSPGDQVTIQEVNRSTANTLLRRNIVLTSVFEGFDKASPQALDVLVDVTIKFIEKFAFLLKSERENNRLPGSKDFQILYKLLDETGYSVQSLFEFVKRIQTRKQMVAVEVCKRFGSQVISPNEMGLTRLVPPESVAMEVDMTPEETPQTSQVSMNEAQYLDRSMIEWEQMTDEQLLGHFTSNES